jgi:hypothetical protein
MDDCISLLCGSVNPASHSPQCVCIVTDTSTPPLPLFQSVTAPCLWHEGDLYDDWSAAGLAMTDNTELQAIVDGDVRPTMLVWRMYIKYMSSPIPQMCSVSPWTHLITWDNTHPFPFARCWCPGSNTIQTIQSISTTSPMAWTWKITNSRTSLPP